MTELVNIFSDKIIKNTAVIEDDGRIGIPTEITVLFDTSRFTFNGKADGTPIIVYVVNTAAERVGTLSDEAIVGGMLDRGYVVAVLDYLGNEKAVCPDLEYSAQAIRARLMKGEFFAGIEGFNAPKYWQTVIVPSGCDISFKNNYWSFDRHGAAGTLEKIVEIWNNDFRGTKGDRLLRWVKADGTRKPTQTAFDGSEPVWRDAKGEECADGEYILVKHTKAEEITDCARPDGSFIDLNLYMHIVYPTEPGRKVPVLCLAGSSEHLCGGAATPDRPHLVGAAFRGYAAVMYDYGYTPMARVDHYEYFDGFPKPGYITGDNPTYSLQFYNDKRINCAAMRYLRLLAKRDGLPFDTEAIGVYGNSKGGWMGFLGESSPETMVSRRLFGGHHDETRYEIGDTETVGLVKGGEVQPWLEYNGEKLNSSANLIYCSCGGTDDSMTAGHAPRFISCNRRDSSCYGTSNGFVNVCRTYDIPTMWVDIDAPHTIVQGPELNYGYDTYNAFFDFCGYYLGRNAVKAVGARVDHSKYPAVISLRFSGSVSAEEMKKVKIYSADDSITYGNWSSSFGGVEWTFVPDWLNANTKYTLSVPAGICGDNGKPAKEDFFFEFTTLDARVTLIEPYGNKLRFTNPYGGLKEHSIVAYIPTECTNAIGLYTADGQRVGFAGFGGSGFYSIDISEYLATLPEGAKVELTMQTEREIGERVVFSTDAGDGFSGFSLPERAIYEKATTPDGVSAIRVDGFISDTHFPTEEMYHSPDTAFECKNIIKSEPIGAEDMGRTFNISFRMYDTVSRYVRVNLNHCTSMANSIIDNRRSFYNVVTTAGQWTDVSIDYSVYEPMYGEFGAINKKLTVAIVNKGAEQNPIYFDGVKVVEKVDTPIIGWFYLVSSEEKYKCLPDGMVDIVCHKSPWSR